MAPDETHPPTPEPPDRPPTPGPPELVVVDRARATAAADDLERKTEVADRARELRDDLIWIALHQPAPESWTTLAGWFRVSRSHVGDVKGNPKIRARVLGEAATG
ncbi:MAG TPA: hypothetical protein VGX21_13185 [Methylomirabilota bacterium]|jgi:hypothetical protein|nr:hypothetical protein [Methylomirabilota bacterium]